MQTALKADELLKKEKVSAEIINLRSLKPLDKDTIISSVKKTGRIIVVEEGWQFCGVGAEIVSIIVQEAFDFLDAEPIRVSGKNVPLPYAENLETLCFASTCRYSEKGKRNLLFRKLS